MNTNKPGLTLIEVMVAVLIMGISVTTIFALQGVLSRGVFSAHALIHRFPLIRNFFVEADLEKFYEDGKPHEKVIDQPQLKMKYSTEKAPKELASLDNLIQEKIETEWPTVFGPHKETFTKLRFFIKQEKKK